MPPLGKVVLEIDAPFNGGTTGVFELMKDRRWIADPQRSYIVGGSGSIVNEARDIVTSSEGDDRREGFYFDAGAGEKRFTIESVTLSETPVTLADGTEHHLQMGNTGDPSQVTALDATGADPVTQHYVMYRYATEARSDSESPARLHIGEWHDGTHHPDGQAGLAGGPLEVTIPEGPQATVTSQESSTVEIYVVCTVVAGADISLDAVANDTR